MLTRGIRDTLETLLVDKPIVVWYDPEGTLSGVVQEAIPSAANLVQLDGSYLRIREMIETGDPNFIKKWIIYVAESPLDPSWIRDYEMFGGRVELSLERILIEKLGLTSDQRIRQLLNGNAGRLLVAHWNEVFGSGEVRLDREVIADALLKIAFKMYHDFSPGKAVLEYVSFPDQYRASLELLGLQETFAELVDESLGLRSASPVPAKSLVLAVLFSEAWVHSNGKLANEFENLLPPVDKRNKWAELCREWQENLRQRDSFTRWSHEIEAEYAIREKLAGLNELVNVTSFRVVDDLLVEQLAIQSASSEPATGFQETVRKVALTRSKVIWSAIGYTHVWNVLLSAIALRERSDLATSLLKSENLSSSRLVELYVSSEGWWRIDQSYRVLSAMAEVDERIRRSFVDPSISAYLRWLDLVTMRFSEAISQSKEWKIGGTNNQRDFWKNLSKTSVEKEAILFIDALRFDLCMRLFELLSSRGFKVSVEPILSSLPSITEVCMVTLLPREESLTLEVRKGDLHVSVDEQRIQNRKDREDWLKDQLGSQVLFLEMDEVMKTSPSTLRGLSAEARKVIVMDRDIDKAGTFLADVSIELFEKLVGVLATAISKLHQSGMKRVTVVTDHGFLLLPKDYRPQTVSISPQAEIVRGKRYALGLPPQRGNLLSFTFNGLGFMGDGYAMFPRGLTMIAAESASEMFTHGGISLQETCIGVLTSLSEETIGKVDVDAHIPDSITSALFFVNLLPRSLAGPAGPRHVQIRVTSGVEVIGESEIVVVSEENRKVRVLLHKLPPEVQISVVDTDTKEILAIKTSSVQLAGYDEDI
jgi:hypothetical protein